MIGNVSIKVDADLKDLEKELESLSLAKNLSKDQKSWQKLLKGQYSTRISQEKKLTNLSLQYQKQGLEKEEADQKALSESRLTGIDAEYARRKRLEDQLLAYTQRKEIANQKKIADARKKFWSSVASTAIGTSVGNLASKGVGAAAKASSGEISSFGQAFSRIELEQALSGRFSKDTEEINTTIRQLRLKSGESYEAIASTLVDFDSQLKNILSKNQQADVIKNLSRFTDNFATISELAGEYASAVAGSDIAKGSEIDNLIGDRQRRRLNRLKDSQQQLVDIGLYESLDVKELETQRQKELERAIERSGAMERTPTKIALSLRSGSLATEEALLSPIKKYLPRELSDEDVSIVGGYISNAQLTALMVGGNAFERLGAGNKGLEVVGDFATKTWEGTKAIAKSLFTF